MPLLKTILASQLPSARRDPLDAAVLDVVRTIMEDVRARGWAAVVDHARRLGDLTGDAPAVYEPGQLKAALDALAPDERGVLERTAARIAEFARAQKACLKPLTLVKPGRSAGHAICPVETAGCYAPGGRFPLPSSVLMTAVTARVAGVNQLWVASPRPVPATLAAAAIAGIDGLLAVGGPQAIAAFAFGAGPVPACDTIVGPGNKWVTAAKHLATQYTTIDMLAGPSEVLIIADADADPALIAADLLAQAEHDTDALAILVTTSDPLIARVTRELEVQLATLDTAAIAREALTKNGYAVLVSSLEEAISISDRIAPEHLEIMTADAGALAKRAKHYGAVFIGAKSAEVMGDYGAGPNHVLPTGGMARSIGGLSVFNFLRVRTWLEMSNSAEAMLIAKDAAALARMEGLHAHARAADQRTT